MPTTAVFDASALVGALSEPDSSAYEWLAATHAGDVQGRVPDLAFAEVANSLLKYVRAGEISGAMALERLEQILDAPLEVHSSRLLARQALGLSILRGVSAYDACYLALALGHDAVLVTADRRLAEAANRAALLPRDLPPPI